MDCTPELVLPKNWGDSEFDEGTSTLIALAEAVDQRDGHIARHCERLAWMCVALGMTLGVGREELRTLYKAGHLHDLGKVGIPDSILLKPARLTDQEWVIMRTHPARGELICRHMQSLAPVLPLIRHHHERWDGSGYPDGLRGEQIPVLARILQTADIYDALINPRPYKPAYSSTAAVRTLREEMERGWRDPYIVQAFFRLLDVIQGDLYTMSESMSRLQLHVG